MQVMNTFIQIDMNADFKYACEKDNPYFVEACRHFQAYVLLMQRVAQFQCSVKLPNEE